KLKFSLANMNFLKNEIKRAAKAIKESTALIFTAGAGMSVDSGLPGFHHNAILTIQQIIVDPLGFGKCIHLSNIWGLKISPSCPHQCGLEKILRLHGGFGDIDF